MPAGPGTPPAAMVSPGRYLPLLHIGHAGGHGHGTGGWWEGAGLVIYSNPVHGASDYFVQNKRQVQYFWLEQIKSCQLRH